MVEAGLGIGILPQISSQTYSVLALKKIILNEPWAHRQIDICVRTLHCRLLQSCCSTIFKSKNSFQMS